MLQARDLNETIEFYITKLKFELIHIVGDEDSPYWCSLQWGGARLMFYRFDEAPISATMTGVLYLFPDDVQALWLELKDTVEVLRDLCDTDYGMKEFAVQDCNGYEIRFGQELREFAHKPEAKP